MLATISRTTPQNVSRYVIFNELFSLKFILWLTATNYLFLPEYILGVLISLANIYGKLGKSFDKKIKTGYN